MGKSLVGRRILELVSHSGFPFPPWIPPSSIPLWGSLPWFSHTPIPLPSSHSQPELSPLHLFVLQVCGEFIAVRQGLGALYLLLLLLPQGDTGWLEASSLSPGKAHPSWGAPHVAAGWGQLAQPVGGLAPRTINRCAQVTAWGFPLHTVGMR